MGYLGLGFARGVRAISEFTPTWKWNWKFWAACRKLTTRCRSPQRGVGFIPSGRWPGLALRITQTRWVRWLCTLRLFGRRRHRFRCVESGRSSTGTDASGSIISCVFPPASIRRRRHAKLPRQWSYMIRRTAFRTTYFFRPPAVLFSAVRPESITGVIGAVLTGHGAGLGHISWCPPRYLGITVASCGGVAAYTYCYSLTGTVLDCWRSGVSPAATWLLVALTSASVASCRSSSALLCSRSYSHAVVTRTKIGPDYLPNAVTTIQRMSHDPSTANVTTPVIFLMLCGADW